MEIKTQQGDPSLIMGERSLNPSSFLFDLPTLIRQMKYSFSWISGEISTMVLFRSADKQIVLAAMHEGTEIISDQTNDLVTFQIIEGKIMLRTKVETLLLDEGHFLTLYENNMFTLTTQQETVLMLTIAFNGLHPESN